MTFSLLYRKKSSHLTSRCAWQNYLKKTLNIFFSNHVFLVVIFYTPKWYPVWIMDFWKSENVGKVSKLLFILLRFIIFFCSKKFLYWILNNNVDEIPKKRDRQIGLNFSDLILQLRLYWISILWNSWKVKIKIFWMFCCEFSN